MHTPARARRLCHYHMRVGFQPFHQREHLLFADVVNIKARHGQKAHDVFAHLAVLAIHVAEKRGQLLFQFVGPVFGLDGLGNGRSGIGGIGSQLADVEREPLHLFRLGQCHHICQAAECRLVVIEIAEEAHREVHHPIIHPIVLLSPLLPSRQPSTGGSLVPRVSH